LTGFVLENKVGQSMLLLNEILSKGFEGQQILSGLAVFFRDLLVCKDPQTVVLFEVGDTIKQKYVETAALCNTQFLYKAIELTNETDLNYRISKNKRLSIELLFIRLCQLNNPLAEEDKKKILIEPITEFSTKVSPPTPPTVSVQPVVYPEIDKQKDNQSVKKNILRIGLKEEEKEEEKISTPEKTEQQSEEEPFTEEQLRTAWRNCANNVTDKHLNSIMLYLNPVLKENDTIEIFALNPEQFQHIQQNTGFITEYLYGQLKNNRIKLEIKIKEKDTETTPLTSREKYTYMVDKNPLLNKLVQEFSLRLD